MSEPRISPDGLAARCAALAEWPDGVIREGDPCALDLRDEREKNARLTADLKGVLQVYGQVSAHDCVARDALRRATVVLDRVFGMRSLSSDLRGSARDALAEARRALAGDSTPTPEGKPASTLTEPTLILSAREIQLVPRPDRAEVERLMLDLMQAVEKDRPAESNIFGIHTTMTAFLAYVCGPEPEAPK